MVKSCQQGGRHTKNNFLTIDLSEEEERLLDG